MFIGLYRPCGCNPCMGAAEHAWRYPKLRYWCRWLKTAAWYWKLKVKCWAAAGLCRHMAEWQPEIRVALEIDCVSDALTLQRRWHDAAASWDRRLAREFDRGASKDFPNGFPDNGVADFVNMTNTEWRHWFHE